MKSFWVNTRKCMVVVFVFGRVSVDYVDSWAREIHDVLLSLHISYANSTSRGIYKFSLVQTIMVGEESTYASPEKRKKKTHYGPMPPFKPQGSKNCGFWASSS